MGTWAACGWSKGSSTNASGSGEPLGSHEAHVQWSTAIDVAAHRQGIRTEASTAQAAGACEASFDRGKHPRPRCYVEHTGRADDCEYRAALRELAAQGAAGNARPCRSDAMGVPHESDTAAFTGVTDE